jgi:hypothetical protein
VKTNFGSVGNSSVRINLTENERVEEDVENIQQYARVGESGQGQGAKPLAPPLGRHVSWVASVVLRVHFHKVHLTSQLTHTELGPVS